MSLKNKLHNMISPVSQGSQGTPPSHEVLQLQCDIRYSTNVSRGPDRSRRRTTTADKRQAYPSERCVDCALLTFVYAYLTRLAVECNDIAAQLGFGFDNNVALTERRRRISEYMGCSIMF